MYAETGLKLEEGGFIERYIQEQKEKKRNRQKKYSSIMIMIELIESRVILSIGVRGYTRAVRLDED